MDFSSNAFRESVSSVRVSNDTVSHTSLVMACRWAWTSSEDTNPTAPTITQTTSNLMHNPISSSNNVRAKRFAPCQGRLYHQLLCSHRIRTDLVEDCGTNCVEPLGTSIGAAFFCNECFREGADKIWQDRKAQHNAQWPFMEQMTPGQRDQWCIEHRQLEDAYAHDRKVYEMESKAKTRPSNTWTTAEVSKEEMDFATELDSLSLSLMASNEEGGCSRSQMRSRHSLPTDPSEQLHWDLNTLALDRGTCGVEYFPAVSNHASSIRQMNEEELWRKPRNRN